MRTIDIEEFVDLADIDPLFYDSGYYLVPDQTTAKAYKLLASAMEKSQKVGIARFVMRTKQYLAAVRPKDGRLILNTMIYGDELVQPEEIGGFDALDKVTVADKELVMATQLIESLTEDFAPDKHRDTYREAVLALIDRKAAGQTEVVAAPVAPSAEKVVDLMAALEASVKAAKAARARHPAAGAEVISAERGRSPRPRRGRRQRGSPLRAARAPIRTHVGRDRRTASVDHKPRQSAVSARWIHQGTGDRLLRADRLPTLLEHIGDRGVTLRRWPNGVNEQSFFESVARRIAPIG